MNAVTHSGTGFGAFLKNFGSRLVQTAPLLVVSFLAGWVVDLVLGTNLKWSYALVPLVGLAVPFSDATFDGWQKALFSIVTAAVIAGIIGLIVGLVLPVQAASITSLANYSGVFGLGSSFWSLAALATFIYLAVLYIFGATWNAVTNR